MANKSRYYTPTRTYEFEVKIGDLDYTPDLYKITIFTSIDIPYQSFILEFFFDPNDIIIEKIYGQTPIKLTARLFGYEYPNIPQEEIVFELMFIKETTPLLMLSKTPENIQKDRAPITIMAVPRTPFITMSTFVNDIFYGSTVESAIQSLVTNNTTASLKYDQSGKNTDKIDQILIPPSTLYECIRYINRTFGIFNGTGVIFTSYDNKIFVKNLTKKITSSHKFTVWQLAIDADNSKILEKTGDGITFYTRQEIKTDYKANSMFALLAPNMKHIVKPRDRLSYTFNIGLEQFSKDYGVISKTNKIFYDSGALSDKRVKIYKDHTGYDLSRAFINADISRKISKLTDIKIQLEGEMKILNLMEVGEGILFNSGTETARDLTGKYILSSSELSFQKSKDWESAANITLSRTNRTIT